MALMGVYTDWLIAALWPFSGKRYMHMFPPLPHQAPQQPAHMAPPGPPPVVHHVYEEGEQRFGYYYPPGQVRSAVLLLCVEG